MNKNFSKIYKLIKKFDTIYIVRHIGPDPDAIASETALKYAILETFPNKKVYALGASIAKFKYFGKLDKVTNFDYDNSLVIALDIPDKKRIDGLDIDLFKNRVKMDHHPLVDKYALVEMINVKASSTCEIILDFINSTKIKCNKKVAENLFMGIVSDSNRFMTLPLMSKTFTSTSNLISKYNLNMTELYNKLYEKPLNDIRLMGYIASNLIVKDNGFAYIMLDSEKLKKIDADISSASNMINDFNNIKEVLVWTFVSKSEDEKLYKINIRSRGPVINEIAAKHNGGGHKFASGAKITTKKEVDELLSELEECCKNYKVD